MGSLAGCLSRLGITGAEADRIRRIADGYRADGVTGEEANQKALTELIKESRTQQASIGDQLRRALPAETVDAIFPKLLESEHIAEMAADKAAYTIFRGPVDLSNKTGQGSFLAGIDRITSGVYGLRRGKYNPVKWFVPFVQTPMNILKQGIEYSPAGVLTIKGAKDVPEQIAKTMIGSMVFATGGIFALNGLTTWAAPADEKKRQAFFDAGMKPYAIKIGNKWVSYSRIGPLAFPFAMAAAFKYYFDEDPAAYSEEKLEKWGKAFGGVAKLFSDQSYVDGIGDIYKALQGEPGKANELVTGPVTQMIPLSSALRWTSNLMDEYQRKADKDFSVDGLVEQIQKGIPIWSRRLDTYKTPSGEPSRKPLRGWNALVPLPAATASPKGEKYLRKLQQESRRTSFLNKVKERIASGEPLLSVQQSIFEYNTAFGDRIQDASVLKRQSEISSDRARRTRMREMGQ